MESFQTKETGHFREVFLTQEKDYGRVEVK